MNEAQSQKLIDIMKGDAGRELIKQMIKQYNIEDIDKSAYDYYVNKEIKGYDDESWLGNVLWMYAYKFLRKQRDVYVAYHQKREVVTGINRKERLKIALERFKGEFVTVK